MGESSELALISLLIWEVIKDPRLTIYVKESEENGYVGVRNGISQTASSFASYQKLSNVNVGEGDKLLVMSAAEAYFLRAEGALRGWNMGGTAKELMKPELLFQWPKKELLSVII